MKNVKSIILIVVGLLPTLVLGQDELSQRIKRVEQGLRPRRLKTNQSPWTLEERMKHHHVKGVSVAVIHDFELDWAKGYGVRNAKTGDPVDDTTLFQVASVTKTIAAAVALKLVQSGILDLDRNVNDYLRSWKVPENEFTRRQKVTLRRILSHSAGLSVHGFRGYAEGEPVPSIIEVLDGRPPANNEPVRVKAEPGTGYDYSGGGYTLLQLLVEDVTGKQLADLAKDLIFDPLGMTYSSIGLPHTESLSAQVALAHLKDGSCKRAHQFLEDGSGCCEMWTTPSDLARFAIAVQLALRGEEGLVLSPGTAKAMLTPTNSLNMGLGFFLRQFGPAVYFSHAGGNVGFSSWLIAHSEAGYGVIVTTNTSGTTSIAMEIMFSVAEVYDWEGF
ncbi:MAG: serine hydrolase domain-containing protein [Candidatus Aminicenantes bacterium]|jgi:CubicO group peptidase (beta-lactamase class C family)